MNEVVLQVMLSFIWGGALVLGIATTLGHFPQPLSRDEEAHYIADCKKGSKEAENVLIERNLRLVAHVAKKYALNINIDLEELQSIGQFGLIKAVASFDPDKGIKLATYASKCIDNEILMYLRSSKNKNGELYLQDAIGVDRDGGEVTLMEVLEADDEPVEEQAELKIEIERMHIYIGKVLNQREKNIIELRFGINGKKEYTQREISKMMGISRSYVSRIEKSALEKLKYAMK